MAGYPVPPDIYLAQEMAVDQETEDFRRDENGDPLPISSPNFGLLVRWDEVEYLEISD